MRDRTVHLFIITHLVFLLGVFFIHHTTVDKEERLNEQITLLNALLNAGEDADAIESAIGNQSLVTENEELYRSLEPTQGTLRYDTHEFFISDAGERKIPARFISYRLVWI
jgi:hypothetical protein